MKTIINNKTDPFYNLALEEYILRDWPYNDELFYLWRNSPSIIIGRNQNAFEEIDLIEIEKDGIPVIRRISGGGSVYHDLGNLNFTFLAPYTKENLNNYYKFTKPIIQVLNDQGIEASFHGKSDIKIKEKKISGNAQSFHQNKMIHHGTLLFDTDLKRLNKYLKINEKYESKSIRSNPSKTINLKEYLPEDFKITELYNSLMMRIIGNLDNIYHLTFDDISKVNELRDKKYQTWEWNFGESPEFTVLKEEPFYLNMNVKEGFIKSLDFNYSKISFKKSSKIIDSLIGQRFSVNNIKEILLNILLEENLIFDFLNNVFR